MHTVATLTPCHQRKHIFLNILEIHLYIANDIEMNRKQYLLNMYDLSSCMLYKYGLSRCNRSHRQSDNLQLCLLAPRQTSYGDESLGLLW